MKILSRIKSAFMRSLSLTSPEGWPAQSRMTDAGEMVNETSVLALSAVWGCTNLLAGTIGSLPLMVYRRDGDNRRVDRAHPLYRLLHDSPNYDQTALDFWEFIASAIELWGNGYARIERDGARISSLLPIQPSAMSVRRLPSGALEYRWSEDGRQQSGTDADVLHIRGFGGSALGGLSTLQYGRNAFGLAQAVDRSAGTTFRNGLRPSGVLTFPEFLSSENRAAMETLLVDKYAGAMHSGRPMILEGGTKWTPLQINPEDAQMLETRRFGVEEICRFFGVPPHMVGHTDSATSWGTGLEQQTLAFQKFTLRRRLKRIEQALMKQLLTPQDRAAGVFIEFSLDGLLRGDSAGRANFYQTMIQIGGLTINEVRAMENLPPVPGGEVVRIQVQNQPITGGTPA